MKDLAEAEQEFYELLKERKIIYSEGNFAEEKTLTKKYGIPQEVIVKAHNEGTILDICAPFFKNRDPIPRTFPELAPRYGDAIIPNAYTLTDLFDVPRVALYGQLKPSFEKRDAPGEIIHELQKNVRKNDLYLHMSDKHKLLEKARLQKNYSPRERIQNARVVIKGADLDGSKESEYKEQKKSIEDGMTEAVKILSGIAGGQIILTNTDGNVLPRVRFKKFFESYPGRIATDVRFKQLDVISEKLERIENCKEIIERYNLDDKYIKAILNMPLGSLPPAWTEVR